VALEDAVTLDVRKTDEDTQKAENKYKQTNERTNKQITNA
jgi:hypothetical protein